ncbi:MAG: twin-arginine translocase TatA/TatE family subunit [Pseudomonadota bacterium]|jgi:sec-independent protein translocase protein TatA
MGTFSIWHWLVVILLVVLLFGRGKISDVMGDVAKGIKSFKKGLSDSAETEEAPPKAIEGGTAKTIEREPEKDKARH